MKENTLVEDNKTRELLNKINKKFDRINGIPQLSQSADLGQVIDVINKITDSMKRRL